MKLKTLILVALLGLAGACALLEKPSEQKIKEDLIGHQVGTAFLYWSFDSLEEFEDFQIVGEKSSGNFIEYKVKVLLRNLTPDGRKYTATLTISYRREGGEWRMVKVTDLQTLKLVTS
jgi:hypothetical protein